MKKEHSSHKVKKVAHHLKKAHDELKKLHGHMKKQTKKDKAHEKRAAHKKGLEW